MRIEPIPEDTTDEQSIAIVTAAHNRCDYCLTAHSVAARALGVSDEDTRAARVAHVSDARIEAILTFAAAMLRTTGRVTDRDLDQARRAGLEDETLLDIVTVVAENTFGNYINNLARTAVDDPLKRAARKLLPEPVPASAGHGASREAAEIAHSAVGQVSI